MPSRSGTGPEGFVLVIMGAFGSLGWLHGRYQVAFDQLPSPGLVTPLDVLFGSMLGVGFLRLVGPARWRRAVVYTLGALAILTALAIIP
jgi:hypothetical protein